jgi:hypothetical protein
MLSVWSSDVAVIWISGVGQRIAIGSPGAYSYSQPHPQPWSEHAHPSSLPAQPANSAGPTASIAQPVADHGPLPVFCGAMTSVRR